MTHAKMARRVSHPAAVQVSFVIVQMVGQEIHARLMVSGITKKFGFSFGMVLRSFGGGGEEF